MSTATGKCKICYKPVQFLCSLCHEAEYCSKACQTADWSVHQHDCGDGVVQKKKKKKKKTASSWPGIATAAVSANGVGYGGDARRDEQTRKAGKKEALKREKQAWKEWQTELQSFTTKKNTAAVGDDLLNTLKQALRQTPPDWWFQQPQRKLIVTALNVCDLLTKDSPKAWGDPEDEESAMAALRSLAQTSKLLVKQLTGNSDTATGSSGSLLGATAQTVTSLVQPLTGNAANKKTHDKDPSLPLRVIQVHENATKAVALVLEKPELSMMGSHDFYRQALRPLSFDTVENAFSKPPHYFAANGGAASYASAMHLPNFMKKKAAATKKAKTSSRGNASSATVLWKELSTYPTALPIEFGSSIFVRTLENQMDKLRVLILGPEDTPYANGCFLFDVTMGNDYPHMPPKVQFLTTSSFLSASDRKVRFNPNLYECGKVCLSLLGTWSGPGWSKESTLLQVLISIQSLILGTADPYFNEPGYEGTQNTKRGKTASAAYNKNIRKQTLQVAILPFLKNQLRGDDIQVLDTASAGSTAATVGAQKDPPRANESTQGYFEEFADVFKQHFKLKQQVLQKQLFQWLQDDKSLEPLYTEYWNVWDQLKEQDQLATGCVGGKRMSGAAKRAATKRAKVDAPAVKMKDGVILLDDDDDAQLNADTASAVQKSVVQSTGGAAAGDAIELADSDDDEGDGKPAAAYLPSASRKKEKSRETKQDSGQNSTEERSAVGAVAAAVPADYVVDLT